MTYFIWGFIAFLIIVVLYKVLTNDEKKERIYIKKIIINIFHVIKIEIDKGEMKK